MHTCMHRPKNLSKISPPTHETGKQSDIIIFVKEEALFWMIKNNHWFWKFLDKSTPYSTC
jgi:hypothetical protein